jgi:hypothetical protein
MKFILLNLALSSTMALAADYNYSLLKDQRSKLVFPKFSSQERQIVIDQARLLYNEVFVHQKLKITHFGESANPIPLLNEVEKQIGTLSDEIFFSKMMASYRTLRDGHTMVILPKPYACYSSSLPVIFKEVFSSQGKSFLAIKAMADDEFIKLLPKSLEVEIGDVLTSYDGLSPEQAIKNFSLIATGANSEAVRKEAIHLLSWAPQAYTFTPKKDFITLGLKNSQGREYQVELPWITRENTKCLSSNIYEERYVGTGMSLYNELPEIYPSVNNDYQKTKDEVLKYKKITNINGTFGVIRLQSFSPTIKVDELIEEIKKIFEVKLHDTDGIIFDVRDNKGGIIRIAETIIQFFTSEKITPLNFRLKATKDLLYILEKRQFGEDHFIKRLKYALQSNVFYSQAVSLDNDDEAQNSQGQFYFKPVVIFTNATCYSSCDMFAALAQDLDVAKVIGEDSSTGGGGAGVTSTSSIFSYLPPDEKGPFRVLPHQAEITAAFVQTLRVGKYKDQLIENAGVKSEQIIKPTVHDLKNDSENQFFQITNYLKSVQSQYTSWVKINSFTNQFSQETPSLHVKMSWKDTTSIEILRDGEVLAKIETQKDNQRTTLMTFPGVELEPEIIYEMVGRFQGKKVWRKVLSLRDSED